MSRAAYAELLIAPNVALVHKWLQASHALYVWLDYPHSGGSGVAYRIRALPDLKHLLLSQNAPELELYVFREEQFPLHGVAAPDVLARAKETIASGQWYSIIREDSYYPAPIEYLGSGNTHAELEEQMSAVFGQAVAVGSEPFDGSDWADPRAVYLRPSDVLYVGVRRNRNSWPEYHPDPEAYGEALALWDATEG